VADILARTFCTLEQGQQFEGNLDLSRPTKCDPIVLFLPPIGLFLSDLTIKSVSRSGDSPQIGLLLSVWTANCETRKRFVTVWAKLSAFPVSPSLAIFTFDETLVFPKFSTKITTNVNAFGNI